MFLEIVILTAIINLSPEVHGEKSETILHQKKFPPCKACKVFIDNFKKGMEKTARGKFEGGDTAWEEQKLGSYANSEIRLTEIQEMLCSDVTEGRDQCYFIHEEHDSILEEWWFHKQRDKLDLFEYFCIDKLEYCCPDNHFGVSCTPCDGYPENICSTNGKCKGAGTREGNGKCICDKGYSGDKCDQCKKGYFESQRNESKLICTQCHKSCDGSCTTAGPAGCTKCKEGWQLDVDKGCVDVDECSTLQSPCGAQQFCINTEGSHSCTNCDKSCQSCTGNGSDMCKECAKGYVMRNRVCIDKKLDGWSLEKYVTQYSFYFIAILGLYVAFKQSPTAAICILIAVAIYFQINPKNRNNNGDGTNA